MCIIGDRTDSSCLDSASEVTVDVNPVVDAELCEEPSVFVTRFVIGCAARIGTLYPSVLRCARNQASATRTKLDFELFVAEALGEAWVHLQMLVVVDVLNPHLDATTRSRTCACNSVAILELCCELGWGWRPRPVHILFGGVGIADGSRCWNVTNLKFNVAEAVGPSLSECRLSVGLDRRHCVRSLGVWDDCVASFQLLCKFRLVDTNQAFLTVGASPSLSKIWGCDITCTFEIKMLSKGSRS